MLACLLVVTASVRAAGRRNRGSHPELCELKTVFVAGESESADMVRRDIEKKTWLTLVNSPATADATLKVAETRSLKRFPIRSERTTISATLTRTADQQLVWSGSAWWDEGAINSGAGSAAKILLGRLNLEAGCAKPKPK